MDQRNRNLLLIGIGTALVLFCCCMLVLISVWGYFFWLTPARTTTRPGAEGPVTVITVPAMQATRVPPAATVAPTASPQTESATAPSPTAAAAQQQPAPTAPAQPTAAVPTGAPTASTAVSTTEQMLLAVDVPQRDPRELALRLKPNLNDIPVVVQATPPAYKVGDVVSFWTANNDTQEHHQISATLRVVTPHVYMWVENGVQMNLDRLQASANRFETKTYPTDREFFGSEWTPGVDSDVHLHILHATNLGRNIAGYYSSADEFSRLVNPYSNEKEMFYISADNVPEADDSSYDGVLAHEFQHMIHWNNDRNEESWVNEGLSELAMHLNGFDVGGSDVVFARQPDTQLNTWTDINEGNGNIQHYGASYLFMDYFLGRFGEDMMKAVVADKDNGIAGFNAALARAGRPERFDDIFADWVVANYLDRPDAEPKGHFGYADIDPPVPTAAKKYDRLPASDKTTVSQYGTDYIQLRKPAGNEVEVRFEGQTEIGLVDTTPRGKFSWWSNRGDDSNSTLTRAFDLTGLKSATLNFATWYDIEEGYDYMYAEASTDGGKHWQILPGRHTTDQDKSGNAFGPGWSGKSGGGDAPQWVDEQVDLSKYAGQKILLRFEYVTDDAVNGSGFLLDDLRIPELNYQDNGENGQGGWQPVGWLLTDNVLPQRWVVQLASVGASGVQVQRMVVGPDGKGDLTVKNDANVNTMMLMVGGTTPVTTGQPSYSYSITTR